MTKKELHYNHLSKVEENDPLNSAYNKASDHSFISMEYAISILEELREMMGKTTVGWRTQKIDLMIHKIKNKEE